jgi:hypothetical protein
MISMPAFPLVGVGALGGTRTPNLLIRSQVLYPLSYERNRRPVSHTGAGLCRPGGQSRRGEEMKGGVYFENRRRCFSS